MVTCVFKECGKEATSAVGMEFWPHEGLMKFYPSQRKCLARIVLTLTCCDDHFPELKPRELMQPQDLDAITKFVETNLGTKVDKNATVIVKVAFDDPEYLRLLEEHDQATKQS